MARFITRRPTAASSSLSDLQLVTISGSGFGTNVAAANQEFTGYSNGPVESLANGAVWGDNLPAGWRQAGGADQIIQTAASFNGTRSIGSINLNDGTNYQFGSCFDFNAAKRVVMARFHVLTVDPSSHLLQTKLVRIVAGPTLDGISDADTTNLYMGRSYNGGIGSFIARNTGGGASTPIDPTADGSINGHLTTAGTTIGNATWYTLEFCATASSAQGVSDGSITWSSRNQTTGSIVAYGTVGSSNLWGASATYTPWRHVAMQMYMQLPDGTGASSACLYVDRDFYITWSDSGTTLPKYILLGNASTYSACTVLTTCTWGNSGGSWSDTSISGVRVNKGAHANLTGKYWYVMAGPNNPINSSGIAA